MKYSHELIKDLIEELTRTRYELKNYMNLFEGLHNGYKDIQEKLNIEIEEEESMLSKMLRAMGKK